MICYHPGDIRVQHVIYSRRGYLVPRADGRLLAGATAEDVGFDPTTTDAGLRSLQGVAVEIVPALKEKEVTDHWAGLRPYADGGLPFIGPVDNVRGLFAAVGHYRNGILLTPITARIIADAVLGDDAASHAGRS
jgi:glycine oxidase